MENIMVNSNVTTLDLNGNEIAVEFGTRHAYYQITNKSDTDFYVSLTSNITPETEGVYTVTAGGSEIIGDGYSFNKFYILGTGKAYIRGKSNAMSASFKKAEGGGDSGSNPELEQEIENLREDVNSLINSSGLGRITIQHAFHFKRTNANCWFKAATLALPNDSTSNFATRGDIFYANSTGSSRIHNGYYSFLLYGGQYNIEGKTQFCVYDYSNADGELAVLYVPDNRVFELWYKVGDTNDSGDVYSAITYSMTDFTVSGYSGDSPVGWSLPDYGVRIPSIPMYPK